MPVDRRSFSRTPSLPHGCDLSAIAGFVRNLPPPVRPTLEDRLAAFPTPGRTGEELAEDWAEVRREAFELFGRGREFHLYEDLLYDALMKCPPLLAGDFTSHLRDLHGDGKAGPR